MKQNSNKAFLTIRQFQSKHPDLLTEHTLRWMCKEKSIPGFYVGNRFLINEQAFLKQLGVDTLDNPAEK